MRADVFGPTSKSAARLPFGKTAFLLDVMNPSPSASARLRFLAITHANVAWYRRATRTAPKHLQGFQKTFRELRQKRLPAWAEREAFDHYYRFAVNTSIPMTEEGKALRVGDPVFLSVGEAGANRGQQATDPSAA